jgi:hypothetical protein
MGTADARSLQLLTCDQSADGERHDAGAPCREVDSIFLPRTRDIRSLRCVLVRVSIGALRSPSDREPDIAAGLSSRLVKP